MADPIPIDRVRLQRASSRVLDAFLHAREPAGHWVGQLSSSALSTATALTALALVDRNAHAAVLDRGSRWLIDHANEDGGWGDTTRSFSNLSTTTLAWADGARQGHGAGVEAPPIGRDQP